MDTPFSQDFETTVNNLSVLQGDIAAGSDRQNLIVQDRRDKALRFTQDVFEERHPAVKGMIADKYWAHLAALRT